MKIGNSHRHERENVSLVAGESLFEVTLRMRHCVALCFTTRLIRRFLLANVWLEIIRINPRL